MRFLAATLMALALMQDEPPKQDGPPEKEPPKAPAIPKAEPADAELTALASRCGHDVQWRKKNNLSAALDEAQESGRPVLAYIYDRDRSSMFGNEFKDRFMMAGAFVDPDLVAFINRKFIPARFRMTKEFGTEVGLKLVDVVVPAVLILSPEGKVLHQYDRITSSSCELLFRDCRSVLVKNPALNKPGKDLEAREKAAAGGGARARYLLGLELLREGEWEKALPIFADVVKSEPKSREAVESLYRSAWILRLQRKAEAAAAAIDQAVRANAEAGVKIEGDLLLERALVHLGQGRRDEACKLLEKIVKDHPKGTRTPEAAYFLGAAQWMADLEEEAKKTWTEMAKEMSLNPWARKAATEALERGPFVNGWESYEWLAADALAGDNKGTERPRKPEEYPEVVTRAVDFVLREQRTDGSWRNIQGQFEFRHCITIIGHMALDVWPGELSERNKAARARARKYIDEWSDGETSAEGMAVWDHMFAVMNYARVATQTADAEAKKGLLKRSRRHVKILEEIARKVGGWTYAGGPSSFTTGGILVALWEARQAGVEVEQTAIDKALEALLKMKSKEDTYFYADRPSGSFGDGHIKGASGRMAVCYLAEYLWGKCDLAKLTWTLDQFIKYRGYLKSVRKSTDWHTEPYAIASYFFFYDYWFASMAVHKLPEGERAKYFTDIRNDLLETNEVDGSWVDTHLFGKPYGTAMALMILKNTGKP